MRSLTRRGRLTVTTALVTAGICWLALRGTRSFGAAFEFTFAALVITWSLPMVVSEYRPVRRVKARRG
jgi:hypothetical protein